MSQSIYRNLLTSLGLQDLPTANDVELSGSDPYVDSVFRIGECASAALGVQAALVAEIWRQRTGQRQSIQLETAAAALATFSVNYQSQHGYAIPQPEPSYPLVQFYPTRDGRQFFLHGAYPLLRNGLLDLLGCSMETPSIANAVAQWNAFELEDAIAAKGLCGAVARSHEEWLNHPQGKAVAATPLVEIIRIGDAPPQPFTPAPRPLSGLKVLDLTHVIAGPTCGKTLAEQGATVIHITTPVRPSLPPFDYDTAHGKLSSLLTLTNAADKATLQGLCRNADVFAESYRPGGLAKLGFSPEAVAELRPGIIYLSVNCYGWAGPWQYRPGWEQLAQVATGMTFAQGTPDNPATQPTYPNDYSTGFLAAAGVLTALIRRAREGGSWMVRVSLCRTSMWIQDQGKVDSSKLPPPPIPAPYLARYMQAHDSALGPLAYLGPVLQYDKTPSFWARQTVPLGADLPAWPKADHPPVTTRPGHPPRYPGSDATLL